MKKLLISILIALLLILSIFLIVQGIHLGKIDILGIKGLESKNSKLDSTIQQAAKLVEKDYKQAVSDVNTKAKKLEEEKKSYEDMVTITGEDGNQIATQIEKYEIEALWVKLGNHAKSEGVVMGMEVIKSGSGIADLYNLKFTVTGSYICITDFISSIENDTSLGFKIEEFKMLPSGSDLQATFVCKDIYIKEMSNVSSSSSSSKDDTTNKNTNSTNTTNSTNNTNNTNNTNTNTNSNTSNTSN